MEIILQFLYNIIHLHDKPVFPYIHSRIPEHINFNYAARGKSVTIKLECKSEISDIIGKTMNMESMIKGLVYPHNSIWKTLKNGTPRSIKIKYM
ncbi:MAG: hypothetical protein AMDU4_FER2C00201G0009 [Ferroplasma sp. Type II]|nr:MAG: hypothetical protein AMDU4_FER2C00201G0009 [Ferroplasma sp. Type II]